MSLMLGFFAFGVACAIFGWVIASRAHYKALAGALDFDLVQERAVTARLRDEAMREAQARGIDAMKHQTDVMAAVAQVVHAMRDSITEAVKEAMNGPKSGPAA